MNTENKALEDYSYEELCGMEDVAAGMVVDAVLAGDQELATSRAIWVACYRRRRAEMEGV